MFALSVIGVKNRRLLYLSFAVGAIGYPLFFGPSLSMIGVIVALLLFVLAERQTKKEIEQGIKINFHRIVSHALKYFVTAVCLVVAIAYYFSITEKPNFSPALVIETKTLETEIDWGLKAAGILLSDDKKEMVEDIANNMSVDDFLSKNFVQPEISNTFEVSNSASDATKLIGNAAAIEVRRQLIEKSKKDLARQLGVSVVGERPMKEVLMAYIDKMERSFFDYSRTDKFYIPVILAFGLFLTARILGTAVDIFLGFMILGIIKLLIKLNMIQISHEQREVAIVEYSI